MASSGEPEAVTTSTTADNDELIDREFEAPNLIATEMTNRAVDHGDHRDGLKPVVKRPSGDGVTTCPHHPEMNAILRRYIDKIESLQQELERVKQERDNLISENERNCFQMQMMNEDIKLQKRESKMLLADRQARGSVQLALTHVQQPSRVRAALVYGAAVCNGCLPGHHGPEMNVPPCTLACCAPPSSNCYACSPPPSSSNNSCNPNECSTCVRYESLASLSKFASDSSASLTPLKSPMTSVCCASNSSHNSPPECRVVQVTSTPSPSHLYICSTAKPTNLARATRLVGGSSNSLASVSNGTSHGYEISQQLLDKQVSLLERKYGGREAREAAIKIQRAFRSYRLQKRFNLLTVAAIEHQRSQQECEGRSSKPASAGLHESKTIANLLGTMNESKRMARRYSSNNLACVEASLGQPELGSPSSSWVSMCVSQHTSVTDSVNASVTTTAVLCGPPPGVSGVSLYQPTPLPVLQSPSPSMFTTTPTTSSAMESMKLISMAMPAGQQYEPVYNHQLHHDQHHHQHHHQLPPQSTLYTSASQIDMSNLLNNAKMSTVNATRPGEGGLNKKTSFSSTSSSASSITSLHNHSSSSSRPSNATSSVAGPIAIQRNRKDARVYGQQQSAPAKSMTEGILSKSMFASNSSKHCRQSTCGTNEPGRAASNNTNNVSFAPAVEYVSSSIPAASTEAATLMSTNSLDSNRKRSYRVGLNLFNKTPSEKGVCFLIEHNFIEQSKTMEGQAKNVARFLLTRKGLSKQMIGEYISENKQFNKLVLKSFIADIDLTGIIVDEALRKFQMYFRFPGEAQKIERLVESFADRYKESNANDVLSRDSIFILSFAIIMLNTDLHKPTNVKNRMTQEQWLNNLRGVFSEGDLSANFLIAIYKRIKKQELQTGADHVTQVVKVQSTIVGRDVPNLCQPHRRLVCYCRLYEIQDVNRKEKVGQHQRDVFLFNDVLLITKTTNRSRSNQMAEYQFRSSTSLDGLNVIVFSNTFYAFGVRITRRVDNKLIATFNARNELDQQRFVDDLQESIAEMDEMEQLRITKSSSLLQLNSLAKKPVDEQLAVNNEQSSNQSDVATCYSSHSSNSPSSLSNPQPTILLSSSSSSQHNRHVR